MTLRVGSWSSRHHTTSVVSPKVQIIAMPEPFSGSASGCARTGTGTPNNGVVTCWSNRDWYRSSSGCATSATHAGDQLGTRGLDHDVGLTVGAVERDPVVRRRELAVFELGLRDRGAVVDIPERRCFGLVRLTASEVAEERALRCPARALADRRVRHRPVDGETEPAPQLLELLLVLDDELVAQRDEVLAADREGALVGLLRRDEVRVVRQRRIAAHAVVVLHPALGGQTVVVPTHRVEDLGAAHPAKAGDRVGLRVPEHRAHVERPAHRRRRGVDRVDLGARLRPVEPVGAVRFPARRPLLLEPVQARLLGELHPAESTDSRSRPVEPHRVRSSVPRRESARRCGVPRRRR